MGIFTIARLTIIEAARRKILLAALILGLLFLVVFGLGFHFIGIEIEKEKQASGMNLVQINEIRNFLLMAGMYVVNFLTAMMIVLTSVDTLSGEISSGTIQSLVAKPIRRWEILGGKWLGFTGMVSLYLILMGGGVMVIVFIRSGYSPYHPFPALAMILLNALLLLSVSLLGGASLSTLANGVLVFGLYGVAFIGGWIEQIGSMLPNPGASQTAMKIGIITSLIIPSEALWKRAAHELESPLVTAMGFSPFSARAYPSSIMIAYSILYILVVVMLAFRKFNQRDL